MSKWQTPSSNKGWCHIGWGWRRTWQYFSLPDYLSLDKKKVHFFPLNIMWVQYHLSFAITTTTTSCPPVFAGACLWVTEELPLGSLPVSIALEPCHHLTHSLGPCCSSHQQVTWPILMAGEDSSNTSPSTKASWGSVQLQSMWETDSNFCLYHIHLVSSQSFLK